MPKLKSKPIRIETGNTNGWQVRFYYRSDDGETKYHSKLFSDGVHGGKDEAYQAAIQYRDENQDAFSEGMRDREIEPYRRRDRRNNSGVPGIMFYQYDAQDGTKHHVRAHVSDGEDNLRTKTLSLAKHGSEEAVKRVCKFRYEGLAKIHGTDNPYPSWQRLYNEIVSTVGEKYGLEPLKETETT